MQVCHGSSINRLPTAKSHRAIRVSPDDGTVQPKTRRTIHAPPARPPARARQNPQLSPRPRQAACELCRAKPRHPAHRDVDDRGHSQLPGQSTDEQGAANAMVAAGGRLAAAGSVRGSAAAQSEHSFGGPFRPTDNAGRNLPPAARSSQYSGSPRITAGRMGSATLTNEYTLQRRGLPGPSATMECHLLPASLPDPGAKLPMTVQTSGVSVNSGFRQSGGPPAPSHHMVAWRRTAPSVAVRPQARAVQSHAGMQGRNYRRRFPAPRAR